MSTLRSLQNDFLKYLRGADTSIAEKIAATDDDTRARRLSIYYNAYRVRLRGSIETDHPILHVYLGDDRFNDMAAAYIDAHPSAQTSLRHFCDALPEFLSKQEAFAAHPVLAEIATFERLLMDVFDAEDAERYAETSLATIDTADWPALRLVFHPSTRLLVTDWNSVDIWKAIKAEQIPPDASDNSRQAWLLWRNPEQLSEFRSTPVDEYEVLRKALDGASFAELCEDLLEWHSGDAVAGRALSLLRRWISSGLIHSVHTG